MARREGCAGWSATFVLVATTARRSAARSAAKRLPHSRRLSNLALRCSIGLTAQPFDVPRVVEILVRRIAFDHWAALDSASGDQLAPSIQGPGEHAQGEEADKAQTLGVGWNHIQRLHEFR